MEEIKFKKRRWINITNPKESEILDLKKRFRFHELDLEDCLSGSQRPKIDEYGKYLFIILHFPKYNKQFHRIDTEQVNFFLGENYLITIHNSASSPLNDIFGKCQQSLKIKRELFGESVGFLLYKILHALFYNMFPIVDKTQLSLKKVEEEIFDSSHPRDQLLDIMTLKKNIITLRKIILPQRSVIAALEHKQRRFLSDDLAVYFDDIVDQIEKVWNIMETQKEVIESLEDTNESLLSHNINLTMRTLTVFSAIMLPLTFITGLFGMNVKFPFQDAPENIEHFWRIIIGMIILAISLFGVFKLKKWL
ncbi:magnesium transporter CorA [Candidatus Peregrinibacteria bacterium CG_4_10_14_0_2_um_filter_43_11]|nr:MAG: magnesium transporter CorA [Candidatus Peregrinibacteria bacterium CG_4_10_14_0_2_um_filter_43_11]